MNFDSLEYGAKRETLKANRKGQNIVEGNWAKLYWRKVHEHFTSYGELYSHKGLHFINNFYGRTGTMGYK